MPWMLLFHPKRELYFTRLCYWSSCKSLFPSVFHLRSKVSGMRPFRFHLKSRKSSSALQDTRILWLCLTLWCNKAMSQYVCSNCCHPPETSSLLSCEIQRSLTAGNRWCWRKTDRSETGNCCFCTGSCRSPPRWWRTTSPAYWTRLSTVSGSRHWHSSDRWPCLMSEVHPWRTWRCLPVTRCARRT